MTTRWLDDDELAAWVRLVGLDERGLVSRRRSPEDRRAADVTMTDAGWQAIVAASPGHVGTVRRHVVDALSREQVAQLSDIAGAILDRLDPEGAPRPPYRRSDGAAPATEARRTPAR